MLGRRKRLIESLNSRFDLLAALLLLLCVYGLLALFGSGLENFIRETFGITLAFQGVGHLGENPWSFLLLVVNMVLVLRLQRFYQIDLHARRFHIVFQSLKCVALGAGLSALVFYLLNFKGFNRSLLLLFHGAFAIWLCVKELALRHYLLDRFLQRQPLEALLVCSAGDVVRRVEDFRQRHLASLRIKRIVLTDGDAAILPSELSAMVTGRLENLPSLLASAGYDLVFLGDTKAGPSVSQQVLTIAEEQGVEVWYFADFLSPVLARAEVDDYGGKPVIVFKTTSPRETELFYKRLMDVTVALAAIICLGPLLILISLAIKLTSPGPILFKQERTGFRGKPFRMWKFRSMRTDAEKLRSDLMDRNEMGGPVFKVQNDPRITPLGRFLRRYSLDELPQFFNVLRGEMSLVGPRPLPVYETQAFEAFRDHRRYSVPPGLTGLWQVSGRSSIGDFSEWVRLDLEYIDRWSLWLDFKILLRTIPAVIKGSGAH